MHVTCLKTLRILIKFEKAVNVHVQKQTFGIFQGIKEGEHRRIFTR
jgi:hypothetical protein